MASGARVRHSCRVLRASGVDPCCVGAVCRVPLSKRLGRAMRRRQHACAAALALCLTYSEAVDCVAAGFAPSLRCGSCATLEALVPDEDIVKDCRSCCADDDKVTYVKARLEVCE